MDLTIDISFNNWQYNFFMTDFSKVEYCDLKCSMCNFPLSCAYSYIILKLRKKGLLKEDFKPLCCSCDFIQKHKIKPTCREGHILEISMPDDYTIVVHCVECAEVYREIKVQ